MQENVVLTEAVFYTLLSLRAPLHGYGIMQKAEQLSKGRVRLAAGTLYGAITTMLEKQWIRAVGQARESPRAGSRKKEYLITELGMQVLAKEIERLRELLESAETILGGEIPQ